MLMEEVSSKLEVLSTGVAKVPAPVSRVYLDYRCSPQLVEPSC
jgi:hypothetical protein